MIEYNNMSEEQKNQFIKEFIEFFNTTIPNPQTYPQAFEFYVKMYQHYLRNKNDKMV